MISTIRAHLTPARQRRMSRLMQGILAGLLAFGLYTMEPKVITNSAVALLITFLPGIFERNFKLPLNPFLALWITAAVFFHTLGSAGLYGYLGWWDHLTHALSASLIAGIGYITVRAIDLHHEEINLPPQFIFVYLVIFVMAFGVIWELFEFGLDIVALQTGLEMPLAQHGLDDTIMDLMFNTLGAVIVASAGQFYLTDIADKLRIRLLERWDDT